MTIQNNLAAFSLFGAVRPQRFNFLIQKLDVFVQKIRVDHIIIYITGLQWNHESLLTSLLAIQHTLRLTGTLLYITRISLK